MVGEIDTRTEITENSCVKYPLLVVACSLVLVGGSHADDKERRDLTAAEQTQLQRDKILLVDRSYLQIFSPYVWHSPPFITSDSVLNAWHVLLQESVRAMEERFAGDLPDGLDRRLQNNC